jgi:hypothetical protein
VAAPGLLVAGQQRLLVGLQEQHAVAHAGGAQVVQHGRQALEVAAAAGIGDDGGARHLGPLVDEQVDQRTDHLRRQVVHAEVALILEGGHRGRLSGPREPRDDHEIRERGTPHRVARSGVRAGGHLLKA